MTAALRPVLAALAAAALALTFIGCAADGDGPTTQGMTDMISKEIGIDRLVGRWDAQSLTGVDLSALPEGVELPWLEILEDGTVAGYTGVNRFTTSLDPAALLDGGFDLAPAAATRRAGPPAAMNLEQSFLGMLDQVKTFGLNDDVLSLLDQSGAVLASFSPGT